MHPLIVDEIILAVGWILQAALAILLFRKGLARQYPVFVLYLLFNLIEDPISWAIPNGSATAAYMRFYYGATILDYLFQFIILFEIGWNVLRPSKRSIPIPIFPVATISVLVCAIIAAIFSPRVELSGLQQLSEVFVRLSLALAVLKLLLFAALAGFAHILGIGWRNHVLRLASGFALYGGVSLVVQLTLQHLQGVSKVLYIAYFDRLNDISSGAYLVTLVYWIWAFSRNEAPRKEFTPQMQQVLVTIAETAKRTRLAVTRSTDTK